VAHPTIKGASVIICAPIGQTVNPAAVPEIVADHVAIEAKESQPAGGKRFKVESRYFDTLDMATTYEQSKRAKDGIFREIREVKSRKPRAVKPAAQVESSPAIANSTAKDTPPGGLNAEATKLVGARIAELERQKSALLAALELALGYVECDELKGVPFMLSSMLAADEIRAAIKSAKGGNL
jgi:hypothetical protein